MSQLTFCGQKDGWRGRSTLLPWWPLLQTWACPYVSLCSSMSTGDWDFFLGPLAWARAETGRADRWVLKQRRFPGFVSLNQVISVFLGYPPSVLNKSSIFKQRKVPRVANIQIERYVINRMLTTRLVQWLSWVFSTQERKKEREGFPWTLFFWICDMMRDMVHLYILHHSLCDIPLTWLFFVSDFFTKFPWTRTIALQGIGTEEEKRGWSLIRAKVRFWLGLQLASLGLSHNIKFARRRDHLRLFPQVPIPWSLCSEIVLVEGKKAEIQKIPLDMSKTSPPLKICAFRFCLLFFWTRNLRKKLVCGKITTCLAWCKLDICRVRRWFSGVWMSLGFSDFLQVTVLNIKKSKKWGFGSTVTNLKRGLKRTLGNVQILQPKK